MRPCGKLNLREAFGNAVRGIECQERDMDVTESSQAVRPIFSWQSASALDSRLTAYRSAGQIA